MGNWQLEVFRMALYISFPIGIFHYFNQPENFEEYVIKQKNTPRAMISRADEAYYRKMLEEHKLKQQREEIDKMEREYKAKQNQQ